MLERVVIVPNGLELGSLAEALAYYQHTEIVYQSGQLAELVGEIGIDGVLRLAESDLVSFLYNDAILGVHTDAAALHPHEFVAIQLHASADGRRIKGPEDELAEAFTHRFGRGTISRRDLRRLTDAIVVRDQFISEIGNGALADVTDPEFLQRAIRSVMGARVPTYPGLDRVQAEAHRSGDRFYLQTNIDFQLANRLYTGHAPGEHGTLTPAYLLGTFLNARAEMLYAGDRQCDMWVDEPQSAFLRAKVNSFAGRLEGGRRSIDRFEEFVFSGRSFSEAVQLGDRSIVDVLDFAEEAETREFKRWMAGASEKSDLLAEYEKSKMAPSRLASSLPMKTARMLLFSSAGTLIEQALGGSGMTGALAGGLASDFVMSQADKMLLSHLQVGWRPDQWVTKKAGPFLRT